MASSIFAPAPWSLNGNGFVLLYHFPHSFVAQWGFLDDYQHEAYRGWLGAVMLVDYTSSNVGPYQELLFIPGLFKMGGNYTFSISKIWVSTEASLQNGQRNWGIPKELANFEIKREEPGACTFKASKGERTFFDARMEARLEARLEPKLKVGVPSIPFTSSLFPLTRITQQNEHQLLRTNIKASGRIKPASLQHVHAEAGFFPPLQRLSPLACLSVPAFQMQFPVAQLVR